MDFGSAEEPADQKLGEDVGELAGESPADDLVPGDLEFG